MAIQSGEKILLQNIIDLATAVNTMYSNRTLEITDAGFSGAPTTRTLSNNTATYDFSNNNRIIELSDFGDLLNKCLAINDIPNLKYSKQNYIIGLDGTTTDILNWTQTRQDYSGRATFSNGHGCRGACVGICSGGCHTSSYGTVAYEYPQSDGSMYNYRYCYCGGVCTATCNTNCGGNGFGAGPSDPDECAECGHVCRACCFGGCTRGCASYCEATCSEGCVNDCTGCTSDCGTSCGTACADTCIGACEDTCQGGCAINCSSSCYNNCKGTSTS